MSLAKPTMKASDSSSSTLVLRKDKSGKSQDKAIGLWSNNFMSNWFFVWTFPIIGFSRGKDVSPNSFNFKLRHQETARVNADDLTNAWNEELSTHKE